MPYKHDDAKCLLVEQNPAGFPDWVADYTRSLRSLYITYGELPRFSEPAHTLCIKKKNIKVKETFNGTDAICNY